jgi:peptidoglycan/LPS O-acetylase OafA/YrhL
MMNDQDGTTPTAPPGKRRKILLLIGGVLLLVLLSIFVWWFFIDPIRLARSHNISPTELRRIESAVFEHQNLFKEKWNEFFNH